VSIEAIDHVNIRASAGDIAKLKRFYCDIVGLRDGWRPGFQSRGHWLYAGEKPVLHLVESAERGPVAQPNGVDHLAFRCASLEPFKQKLQIHGIEYQLSRIPDVGNEQLLFRDPLGIGVELSAGSV
jgi:catechol 2,3-dioxygenase-like lactoylglutathione lyase family enzyme